MTDIILHHYEISPYSEKVRLGLGLKGLAWGSVGNPCHHAKTRPDGADRRLPQDRPCCRSAQTSIAIASLIMRELERRHPTPSFLSSGTARPMRFAW